MPPARPAGGLEFVPVSCSKNPRNTKNGSTAVAPSIMAAAWRLTQPALPPKFARSDQSRRSTATVIWFRRDRTAAGSIFRLRIAVTRLREVR